MLLLPSYACQSVRHRTASYKRYSRYCPINHPPDDAAGRHLLDFSDLDFKKLVHLAAVFHQDL